MKRIAFVLVFFIYSQIFVFSQKYRPFDSTTVWVANQVYKVCTNCYINRDIKYYSKGYELNNSRVWYKLYYNDATSFFFCTTCTSTPLPSNINKLLGYYSNDTVNKKVYLHSSITLPPNYNPVPCEILYDYNKIIGDTITIRQFQMCPPYWQFKINNIDSVLFSGKYHKRFLTTCTPIAPPINSQQVAFTEGIGNSLGPFEPMVDPMGERYSYLNCFSSPTQTVTVTNYTVFSAGTCANITLDIKETKSTQNVLYPNPNNGAFKLKVENEIDEIILYNSFGQKVYEQKLNRGTNDISAHKLAQGLYHYVLFQNKQRIESGTMTVE